MPLLTPAQIIPLVDSIASPEFWTAVEFATVNLGAEYTAITVEAERRGWSDDENFRAYIREVLGVARTAWEAANLGGSGPSGGAPVGASAAGTGSVVAANGTHRIDFDSIEYDSENAITTGVNWRYTIPQTGIYQINVGVSLTVPATGATDHELQIDLGGGNFRTLGKLAFPVLNGADAMTLAGSFTMIATLGGEEVFAQLIVNNEADDATIVLSNSVFSIVRLGDLA